MLVSLFVMYVYKFICIIGKCFFFKRPAGFPVSFYVVEPNLSTKVRIVDSG